MKFLEIMDWVWCEFIYIGRQLEHDYPKVSLTHDEVADTVS